MNRHRHRCSKICVSLTLLAAASWSARAMAQEAGGGASAEGAQAGSGSSSPSGQSSQPGVIVTPPVVFPTYPGAIAPTDPGKPLGGGNVDGSSSRPIVGNERDGFDLGRPPGSGETARGSEGGNIIFGTGLQGIGPVRVPATHTVRRGDTLWDICAYYFRNPYEWPRIWAMNPGLKNPHWIEPGEIVRLQRDEGQARAPSKGNKSKTLGEARAKPGTLFLTDESFVELGSDLDWGELEGSREERVFLTNGDEAYLRWDRARDLKVGQELTIFREVKKTQYGSIVELQGQLRIDTLDAKHKKARARVFGANKEIERGARFGPIVRRFEVVPPKKNEVTAQGVLFAALKPGDLYAPGQVVFVNLGSDHKLEPGNTLEVLRRGDGLQRTMPSRSAVLRIETGGGRRDVETIAKPKDPEHLKDEILGTLRVLAVGKKTATCFAVESKSELESGERVLIRKGH